MRVAGAVGFRECGAGVGDDSGAGVAKLFASGAAVEHTQNSDSPDVRVSALRRRSETRMRNRDRRFSLRHREKDLAAKFRSSGERLSKTNLKDESALERIFLTYFANSHATRAGRNHWSELQFRFSKSRQNRFLEPGV